MIERRPPTFCLDCNKPISATAVRCQKCAMRHRARTTPIRHSRPTLGESAQLHGLSREQVRWLRDTESELHVSAIAQRLNVDPDVIRAIRLGNDTSAGRAEPKQRRAV